MATERGSFFPKESPGEPPSLESMATGSHKNGLQRSGCKAGIRASKQRAVYGTAGPDYPVWAAVCSLLPAGALGQFSLWRRRVAEGDPWELVSKRGSQKLQDSNKGKKKSIY